jgi:hypothetical protein
MMVLYLIGCRVVLKVLSSKAICVHMHTSLGFRFMV